MRAAVVVFPGSNCDHDLFWVLNDIVGLNTAYVWHEDTKLVDFDLIVLPGGFSYGDYLRSGAIAARSPIMDAVRDAAEKGRAVIGICNGFQILTEAGLLPGALLPNINLRFISTWVYMRVENNSTVFTHKYRKGEIIRMPIAHAEGRYYVDNGALTELQRNGQIVFRYSDAEGNSVDYCNPNGSIDFIAGICNRAGNVLGLMPHPERCCERSLGGVDGLRVFTSLVQCLSS